MRPLPRGITGFRDHTDPPLPYTDFRAFQTVCHTAARFHHGQVGAVEPTAQRHVESYGQITLDLPTGSVLVLIQRYFPWVAFGKPVYPGTGPRFTDAPDLAVCFEEAEYRVLTVRDLEAPVTAALCRLLGESEQKQIRYWRPATVGALIFNAWD